jgi:hypothetical protein
MTMFSQNIITTLCGIDTSKAEEHCNNDDDDDDNDTDILNEATFLMRQVRPQMIVMTMNLDFNIQILPLVILLDHESQGLHNHRHLAFYNSFT